MAHRQRAVHALAGPEAAQPSGMLGDVQQAGVAEHHALGRAGRARGVDQRADVARRGRRSPPPASPRARGEQREAGKRVPVDGPAASRCGMARGVGRDVDGERGSRGPACARIVSISAAMSRALTGTATPPAATRRAAASRRRARSRRRSPCGRRRAARARRAPPPRSRPPPPTSRSSSVARPGPAPPPRAAAPPAGRDLVDPARIAGDSRMFTGLAVASGAGARKPGPAAPRRSWRQALAGAFCFAISRAKKPGSSSGTIWRVAWIVTDSNSPPVK